MKEAFKLSERAFSKDEVPIGAVVVLHDRIIGKGYNQVDSLGDPTACLLYTSPSPRDPE